ncbi:unnamed protein product [Gadus morhua 'NCC']
MIVRVAVVPEHPATERKIEVTKTTLLDGFGVFRLQRAWPQCVKSSTTSTTTTSTTTTTTTSTTSTTTTSTSSLSPPAPVSLPGTGSPPIHIHRPVIFAFPLPGVVLPDLIITLLGDRQAGGWAQAGTWIMAAATPYQVGTEGRLEAGVLC